MTRPLRAALLVLVAAALLGAAPAAQAEPAPFGHACSPTDGVRFCPTIDLASRVPSFDGVPLDVDVTLPATGDGPFPTILLLHGLGGTKTSFERSARDGDPLYDNVAFAQRGYAVVTPTARGFGNSCGVPASRTTGCERGWTHLGDVRFEVRDLQTLIGRLVDEGITRPDAIGSTGISYGGGFSMMLAFLHDRVRLENGTYAPWTSPNGTPISLTAAWPRWLWSNGESIFVRTGRSAWTRQPVGVITKNYLDGIFATAATGFVAPSGADPSADLTLWKRIGDAGVLGPASDAILQNAWDQHGVTTLGRGPAPLLMESGWTDGLFPVGQALSAYNAVRKANPGADIALQVADLGHNPAANHPGDTRRFDELGNAFLDAWLLGGGAGAKPTPGSVTALTMTCPKSAASGGGPYTAGSWDDLAPNGIVVRSSRTIAITSRGASARLAAALAPLNGDLCKQQPIDRSNAGAELAAESPGITMLGMPVLTGRIAVTGRNGQLDARLWDRNMKTGRQRLITRGAYRLRDNEQGDFKFTLDGNGWRFAPGHRIVVELLGRDAPTYLASTTRFSARITGLKLRIPIRKGA